MTDGQRMTLANSLAAKQLPNMSTKTKTKINKLPAGLPPLPPVPAGYDAWEYMGEAVSGITTPWASSYLDGLKDWCVIQDGTASGGYVRHFYIRAIKHPAPKPAAKGRKAVKTGIVHMDKAGRCWAHKGDDTKRVAVIELSDEAALIEQARNAACREKFMLHAEGERIARAVLESLGLIAKRRK